MQKKVITHPFHKITFDYDDSKEWTARDEKLLNVYLKLHDSEAERNKAAQELRKEYGEHDRHIAEVRKELKKLKEKVTATRDAADHILAELNLKHKDAMDKFVKKVNTTNDAIQDYDKILRKLEGDTMSIQKKKDKFHDEEESDEPLWELLSDLKITYAHDNRLATDYVSFDDDEQRFRDRVSYASRQNDNCINYCNTVIENYNRLVVETEVQYEVWKEFCRRMTLIQHISNLNAGYTEISGN